MLRSNTQARVTAASCWIQNASICLFAVNNTKNSPDSRLVDRWIYFGPRSEIPNRCNIGTILVNLPSQGSPRSIRAKSLSAISAPRQASFGSDQIVKLISGQFSSRAVAAIRSTVIKSFNPGHYRGVRHIIRATPIMN